MTVVAPKVEKEEEQVVNPWEVSAGKGGIDYDKLVDQFGCQRLDAATIDRVARLTGRPPHRFLRRGLFFAHRDFNEILDLYEKGEKFYLYTGRGPSSEALHLGHLVPFMFTNAFYENMVKVARCVTYNKVVGIFGFSQEDHIGKISFPPVQAVPSFPSSFPHPFSGMEQLRCLIPCAIDQDPYFRMTRDVAPRIGCQKPSLTESRFFPALQGESTKMSASDPNSAIYVTDSEEKIKMKVNKYAFSGGQDSAELQRELGANLEVDVPIKYLNFFLEDDHDLEQIKKGYGDGSLLTGKVKNLLGDVLYEVVKRHTRARAQVTEEMVDAFMAARPLPNMFG
ncbi:tryptophan--tRNA ligase, cytoplasmic-like isoform X2 [Triticum dicoccoides]|uniref:tryptophan--tRNA ligase, cytoplasmic-like isoform X2 n=1 Tax=Triticum dicoccoides TaxID=85692 RepID=UPI001890E72A|nr:tryptophan--tRNA ligase, cytoplasmic-like isoform X2 [Triticum dicoccoides]